MTDYFHRCAHPIGDRAASWSSCWNHAHVLALTVSGLLVINQVKSSPWNIIGKKNSSPIDEKETGVFATLWAKVTLHKASLSTKATLGFMAFDQFRLSNYTAGPQRGRLFVWCVPWRNNRCGHKLPPFYSGLKINRKHTVTVDWGGLNPYVKTLTQPLTSVSQIHQQQLYWTF